MSGAISVKNISKQFKDVKALDDITLNFEENKIYGLLGRNGAGKSTLLNIISNRLFPQSGSVTINGEDAFENDKAQGLIYVMSEKTLYPETMRVSEALKWSAEFYKGFDMEYAQGIAERFGLNLKSKVKGLSTGYGSIFKLVIALSCNAPYVLLDEPVLGLDANHRELFYKMLLEKYSENPFTVVISTHLIEEISSVIENIIIIKDGKILYDEAAEELMSRGYTISGSTAVVEEYLKGCKTLSCDYLGGLCTACVLGKPEGELPQGLELGKLDLQKFFVALTNV